MKKLRISVLMLEDFVPPANVAELTHEETYPFKTEYDVLTALEDLGHDVQPLGVRDDLAPVRQVIKERRPHIIFNLLEEFHGHGTFIAYVVGYFELLRQAYTGCNAEGLMLTRNKALAKKILRFHRIRLPDFTVVPRGKGVRRPARLEFPLIVKSATEHGSVGIAQASVCYDDEKLAERVAFVHDSIGTDALVEEFIEGREFYVGVLGNHRLMVFPVWELPLDQLPVGVPQIATEKIKWDIKYQLRRQIRTGPARDLSAELTRRIQSMCKKAYRVLGLSGYARFDLRVTADEKIYLIEPNPNPHLEYGEDFAESAHAAGIPYEALLQSIVQVGLRRARDAR